MFVRVIFCHAFAHTFIDFPIFIQAYIFRFLYIDGHIWEELVNGLNCSQEIGCVKGSRVLQISINKFSIYLI